MNELMSHKQILHIIGAHIPAYLTANPNTNFLKKNSSAGRWTRIFNENQCDTDAKYDRSMF